jgi:hypothetical protein
MPKVHTHTRHVPTHPHTRTYLQWYIIGLQ